MTQRVLITVKYSFLALIIGFLIYTMINAGFAIASGNRTPEAAVQRAIPQLTGLERVEEFRMLTTRAAPQGTIIVYYVRGQAVAGLSEPIIGSSLVNQLWDGWHVSSGSAAGISDTTPPNTAVCYKYNQIRARTGPEWVIYGPVLNPAVVAVEVTFDNQPPLQDRVENGAFAIGFVGDATPQMVHGIDSRQQVVQEIPFSIPPTLDALSRGYGTSWICGAKE